MTSRFIVAKCPIRISLAGGGTDLNAFLQKHNQGAVISFTADMHTFIMLHQDKLGQNGKDEKYIVEYMKREVLDAPHKIQNDIARVCIEHFKLPPVTCWFTSDFYSVGSGLAASSSYLNSFVRAACIFNQVDMSNYEICTLSHTLEKTFNPMTGYQDPYGCGLGGLKRLDFTYNTLPHVSVLDGSLLKEYDIYLVHTGIARRSTPILETIDPDKCLPLVEITNEMHQAICQSDGQQLLAMINEGWALKKLVSKRIASEPAVVEIDEVLNRSPDVVAHRLLGAGAGGYFLIFCKSGFNFVKLSKDLSTKILPIDICHEGISVKVL